MQVGNIVYSRYPRRDGDGSGIVLKYKATSSANGFYFPSRAKVYWSLSGRTAWHRAWDLFTPEGESNEGR